MNPAERKVVVAPSILSADFSRLKEELRKIESAGADMVHLDVMDGVFVPNITIGPPVVEAIRRCTSLPLDVHLMIEAPHRFVRQFSDAGSDIITIHAEAYPAVKSDQSRTDVIRRGTSRSVEGINKTEMARVLRQIRSLGKKAGVSLNPGTPVCLQDVLNEIDMVLIMSVHPGFGGQDFIEASLDKVKDLRSVFDGDIEIDGGINDQNARPVVEAGANVIVAGSYFFASRDPKEAVKRLRVL